MDNQKELDLDQKVIIPHPNRLKIKVETGANTNKTLLAL
jgi:hypothetical protein